MPETTVNMKANSKLKHLLCCLCLLTATFASSQTLISGTINTYTDVTLVGPCPNKLNVTDPSGLSNGTVVIIIQMQGATIDETNSSAFGTVSSYSSAGLWEKAIVLNVVGTTVSFTKNLVNTYSVAGRTQLIKMPSYTNATVNGTLTGTAWNGSTGGVIALEVTGTLLLNSDINASGIGFRGGANTQVCPNSCSFLTNENAYFYATGNYRGAFKGEGVAAAIASKELGRGAQGNGGGGGNDHNNGGAGGSNYAVGGVGGNNAEPGSFNCKGGNNYGRGGVALNYTSLTKLFLGGGGGAGHGNNGPTGGCNNTGYSGAGGNGGGIVIIIANTINGNAHSILANGSVGGLGGGDGAGGGGGGGVIFVSATNYTNNLTLNVQGGIGGNSENFTSNRCIGPGGGGGAGTVISNAALPGNVNSQLNGGAAGIITLSTNGCNGTTSSATDGGGSASALVGATIPQGNSGPNAGCGLPVTFIHFFGKAIDKKIELKWATATEVDASHFVVERSKDGSLFSEIGQVVAAGNTTGRTDYEFTDPTPFPGRNYYRLRQVDVTGYEKLTTIINVDCNVADLVKSLYPNPLPDGEVLLIEFSDPEKTHSIRLTDLNGRTIRQWIRPGNNLAIEKISINGKQRGVYLLQVSTPETTQVLKLVLQ